jgi:hypothetical protein
MVEPNDTRLFVKNGELISPHNIYVFELDSIEGRPELGHDEVRYHEIERRDFDPTGCVPKHGVRREQSPIALPRLSSAWG